LSNNATIKCAASFAFFCAVIILMLPSCFNLLQYRGALFLENFSAVSMNNQDRIFEYVPNQEGRLV
jgi:hypothetical protein